MPACEATTPCSGSRAGRRLLRERQRDPRHAYGTEFGCGTVSISKIEHNGLTLPKITAATEAGDRTLQARQEGEAR
jgi:hypothetical protein